MTWLYSGSIERSEKGIEDNLETLIFFFIHTSYSVDVRFMRAYYNIVKTKMFIIVCILLYFDVTISRNSYLH